MSLREEPEELRDRLLEVDGRRRMVGSEAEPAAKTVRSAAEGLRLAREAFAAPAGVCPAPAGSLRL